MGYSIVPPNSATVTVTFSTPQHVVVDSGTVTAKVADTSGNVLQSKLGDRGYSLLVENDITRRLLEGILTELKELNNKGGI